MATGLYFGSFNPLHIGHIQICRYLLENSSIEEIYLIVSPQNPLKEKSNNLSAQERLEAARSVIARSSLQIKVSDIEFSIPPPQYTINTLRLLKENEPEKEFILIIGADNLAIIERWYKYREILEQFEVWVYPRRGFDGERLSREYGVKFINAPLIEVSSTQIREGEKAGRDMSHLRA